MVRKILSNVILTTKKERKKIFFQKFFLYLLQKKVSANSCCRIAQISDFEVNTHFIKSKFIIEQINSIEF